MEYIPGGTLKELIAHRDANNTPLTDTEIS